MNDKQHKVDTSSIALAGGSTSEEGNVVKPHDHGRSLSIATSPRPSPASRPDLSPHLLELLAASLAASQSATLSAQAKTGNNNLLYSTTPSNSQILDALQRQTSAAAQSASRFNNDYVFHNNLQQRNNLRAAALLANNEILHIPNVLASRPPLQQQQQQQQQWAHAARSSFLPPQHIPIMTHHGTTVAVPNTTIAASTPGPLDEVLLSAGPFQQIRPDSLRLLLLSHQVNPNTTTIAAAAAVRSTPAGLSNETLLSALLQQIRPEGTSRREVPTAIQILLNQVNNQARDATAQYLPQPLVAPSTPSSFGTHLIGLPSTTPPARRSQQHDQKQYVDRKPDATSTTTSGLASKKHAGTSDNSSTPDDEEPKAKTVVPKKKKKILELTNRPSIALALDSDEDNLSRYQCLARKQIELFETTDKDIAGKAQGRNTPIIVGQVGIRCRHCASFFPRQLRSGGSVYYSKTLSGIYQVSQNMFKTHLLGRCHNIPKKVRKDLLALKEGTIRGDRGLAGGKLYWRESVQALGVIEDEHHVLRFTPDNSASKT
jgi:hypothetical protein